MTGASQVIYVHGFGGRNNVPKFCTAIDAYFQAKRLRFDLKSFAWDSLPLDLRTLTRNFLRSQDEARQVSPSLLRQLLELESQQIDYYLIGFSLGAAIVRHALADQTGVLAHLRGVYFLGGAFNFGEHVNVGVIPSIARCHNYFSPTHDMALNTAHFNVTGVPAAGSRPLSDAPGFQNLATHCSHALVHNYSALAPAIGALVAWDDGQYVAGESNTNVRLATMGGKACWDEICHHSEHLVQQNLITKHFRAIEESRPNRRKAWGRNLHAVLRAI